MTGEGESGKAEGAWDRDGKRVEKGRGEKKRRR